MPRTYSSIDKIRAELAWVNETPDPKQMRLSQSPALRGNWTQARSSWWEYYCASCRVDGAEVSLAGI